MIRDFCSGVTRAKIVVLGSSATRACVVELLELLSCDDRAGVEADLAAEVRGDLAVVAGDDLDGDPEAREPGERVLDVGLDRVGEAEKALEGEVVLVVLAEVVGGERAACDRDDSRARGEESVESRLRLGGDGRAAGKDGFRRALGDQHPALLRVGEDRGQLALVVEGQAVERRRNAVAVDILRCGPERAVELVAGLVAAGQTEHANVIVRLARAVERLRERDLTLGQGAGLVREQHLDVAEVLDRDQTFDDHAFLGQPAGARREADGHDRRQAAAASGRPRSRARTGPTGGASARARR